MQEIYFSIIVPVYNVEKYIRDCIQSILDQTYTHFELILVDDGSPDNAGKICDEYSSKDDRVRVLHTQNNGVVYARQYGVENSHGDYLVFVDADDWIASDCLETYNQIIMKSDSDIICSGHYMVKNETYIEQKLQYQYGLYSNEDIEREIYPILIQSNTAQYFAPSLWGKAFKSELYKSNQFKDCKVEIGEDGASVIPCVYCANTMYITEECLYYYRKNYSSVTRQGKVYKWENAILVNEHIQNKIDLSVSDYKLQWNRKLTHDLFTVAVSQFNARSSYREICKNVKAQLSKENLKQAIVNSRFKKGTSAHIMHMAIKYKCCVVMWIYAKIKRILTSY